MLHFLRILVGTIVLGVSAVSLSACGQQGALYLPAEPRATLPETLWRGARPEKINPPAPPALSPVTPAPALETTPVLQ